MAENKTTIRCEKCKKFKQDDQYYTSNNLVKYPTGKIPICKNCMTLHVDNWEPDTYKPILEECDVPYVPAEWNQLMVKFASDPSKVSGTTIVGRYLSKMRLQKWKNYRWKDSEHLQKMSEKQIADNLKENGASQVEIDEAIADYNSLKVPRPQVPEDPQDYFGISSKETAESLGLTPEDVTYLRLKWSSMYEPEEWVQLEQLYEEMMKSYDIQTAGHIDTLKLLCKASLRANKLIDLGDIEPAQKMIKVYNDLMKSGNFMAVQNKKDKGEFVDSVSELVYICEKEGFIPRYYQEEPGDRVDETILDLKKYTRSLIVEELHLGEMIESAVKEMVELESKEEDDEDDIMSYGDTEQIKEEDYIEFQEFLVGEEESVTDIKE